MFTYEELLKLPIQKLLKLANYLGIPANKKSKKSELAEEIFNKLQEGYNIESSANEPQMSVRVRRISESSRR